MTDADVTAAVARLRTAGCVFAEDEARLLVAEATSDEQLDTLVAQRVSGVPLEHVLGWAAFAGLRVAVEPGVFVPRRRSELLAAEAVAVTEVAGARPVVVELCCGAGAVAAVIAAAVPHAEVHAVDVEAAAVRCARRNLPAADVYQGDLYAPLPRSLRGRVDVIVANAPYVPSAELGLMPAEARDHEPRVALDGGDDGIAVQRRIAAEAPLWLAPGGHLLVETSERQSELTLAAYRTSGLLPRLVRSTDLDATVAIGARPLARGRG
jgi:release factor glutamine methyltransferase